VCKHVIKFTGNVYTNKSTHHSPSKKDRSWADKPDFSADLVAAVLTGDNVGVADLLICASGGDEISENAVDVFTVGFVAVIIGGDNTSVAVGVIGPGGGGANKGKYDDEGRGGGVFDTEDIGESYRIGDIGGFIGERLSPKSLFCACFMGESSIDQLLALEPGGGGSGAGIGEGGAGQRPRLAAAFCVSSMVGLWSTLLVRL